VASLVELARARCEQGLLIGLADQGVSFWSDVSGGVVIARTIFGPYCTIDAVPPRDRGLDAPWRAASAEVPRLAAVVEHLVEDAEAGGVSPAAVRRWAGDFPADRYDIGPGRCFVVHHRPFAGVTVFLRDEREILYLRPGSQFDVPHTEHVIKYPLRVALRRAGFSQVHAAACSFRGRGLLLMGQRGSGKSTLLMQLLSRGARFISNDFAMVRRVPGGGGRMVAFPHMLRIAPGTIRDNETLSDGLSRMERSDDYLRSPVFNVGKEELYFPVLARIWGGDVICREALLDVILFPALHLDRTASSSSPLPTREVARRILYTQTNDPPTLDWLPFMTDAQFRSLARANAVDMVRCTPAAHEVRFGARTTDPVGAVERILDAHTVRVEAPD
jgi:hypothetical protein